MPVLTYKWFVREGAPNVGRDWMEGVEEDVGKLGDVGRGRGAKSEGGGVGSLCVIGCNASHVDFVIGQVLS